MEPRSGNQNGKIADSFCTEAKGLRPEIAPNQGFRANSGAKSVFLVLIWR
jgi:hypothetical protein